jgi:hypothetical protein
MVKTPNSPLSPWICLVGDAPVAIPAFDYFISYGAFHLLDTLHIHPWSWLPLGVTHVNWLRAFC